MTKRRVLDSVTTLPATIRHDVVHIGNLKGRDNYVVHGEVQGNADIDGMVMLGPSCKWCGNIIADVVVVKGLVVGNITARFKVELRGSAQVQGDLQSPLIAVAEGAVVQGHISQDSVITHFQDRRSH